MNKHNSQLHSFHTIYFIIFSLVISQSLIVSHACHEGERIALLSFKSQLEDPANRLSSWQEGKHHQNCCNWHGVGCSNESFHVVKVDLGNTIKLDHNDVTGSSEISTLPALTGKIPPSLFTLTHLEYLDLSFNKFTDTKVPDKFSNLKNLRHLDISNSGFSGSITTQFSNLSSLEYLDISCSFIATEALFSTSTMPLVSSSTKWVKGLVNLNVLKLAGVNLHEAAAASSQENFAEPISFLSNLRHLDLSGCSIAIPFPIHQFHNLSHLSYLRMNFNYLNSPIPIQVANLTSLSILHLSGCQLQGTVPYLPQLRELHVSWNFDLHADLTFMLEEHQWPKLEILDISKTFVGKAIPSSISNAPLLISLFASRCSIQESIPSSIYNLSRLQSLDLSENNIIGNIPSSISNLRHLQFLDLSVNNFQGHIPNSICKISFLKEISLASNKLTGITPSCITKLQNLQYLDLSPEFYRGITSLISMINDLNLTSLNLNSINITVDRNLVPWTKYQLESLELKSCNMKGYIPTFICNLTHLKNLDLSHNMLTGAIPLNLSNNNLHGPLPLPPQNSYTFDLSQNIFSGEISLETGKRLSGAHFVSLSGNKLLGPIPSSFCVKVTTAYSDLNYLDLSNNQLSGTIPYSVGYCISLFSLNLGRNNFTGNVPNELEQARELRYLQLSDNSLNGSFPSFITKA
ncbi:hypothetical protein MKW92_033222 [Papaver armeniacum]|nr:hypothetical protein MKW92_033222 [Papaver armeniacum]